MSQIVLLIQLTSRDWPDQFIIQHAKEATNREGAREREGSTELYHLPRWLKIFPVLLPCRIFGRRRRREKEKASRQKLSRARSNSNSAEKFKERTFPCARVLKRPHYNVCLRISWFIYFVRYAPSCAPLRIPWLPIHPAISLPRYHNYSRERTTNHNCTPSEWIHCPVLWSLRCEIIRGCTKFRNNKSRKVNRYVPVQRCYYVLWIFHNRINTRATFEARGKKRVLSPTSCILLSLLFTRDACILKIKKRRKFTNELILFWIFFSWRTMDWQTFRIIVTNRNSISSWILEFLAR